MERVHKALQNADPEVVEEISQMLFGDGADEIVKSLFGPKPPMTPQQKQKKNQQTQARVGLASNVVGIGAGVAGTAEAATKMKNVKGELRAAKTGGSFTPKVGPIERAASSTRFGRGALKPLGGAAKAIVRNPGKTAAAGLGLQVANVAGDAVANRVLARSAKKQPVGKSQDFEITQEIAKTDDDKRLVFGWASIIKKDGKPVVDLQGDYIDADTLEKAAYEYVTKSRKGGYEHHRDGEDPKHVSDMVESLVITEDKKKALGLPDDFPEGWWAGYRINDEDVWKKVKDGDITEFSIHGSGLKRDYEVQS